MSPKLIRVPFTSSTLITPGFYYMGKWTSLKMNSKKREANKRSSFLTNHSGAYIGIYTTINESRNAGRTLLNQ